MPTCFIPVEPKTADGLARPGYAIRAGSADAADLGENLEIFVDDPTDTDEIDEAVEDALRDMDLDPSEYTWDADEISDSEN